MVSVIVFNIGTIPEVYSPCVKCNGSTWRIVDGKKVCLVCNPHLLPPVKQEDRGIEPIYKLKSRIFRGGK